MKTEKWYQDPRLLTAGISITALVLTQILQILFFVVFSALLMQKPDLSPVAVNTMALVPTIIAVLCGGAFLGRLKHSDAIWIWLGTSIAAGILPLVIQALLSFDSLNLLLNWSFFISSLGNTVLWIAGCWLGAVTQKHKPDQDLDGKLLRWTASGLAVIVFLYGMTWGSIIFSKGYRMAKQVELTVPPDVEIVETPYREPGVAKSIQFKKRIKPNDSAVQSFYLKTMAESNWTDVTGIFQDWSPGEWQKKNETWQGQTVEYQLASAHWQDISGKVMVSMVIQAQKADETKAWDETDWMTFGVILSRPYAEPPDDTHGSDLEKPGTTEETL